MTMKHDALTLPPACIRGPELYNTTQIANELRTADDTALAAYDAGVALLRRAHALLAAEARLAEAKRTRDFLIAQLVTLEARDTAQFDAALASYRRTSCGEEPVWHPPPEARIEGIEAARVLTHQYHIRCPCGCAAH